MTDFTLDELQHEQRMSDDGETRYWASTLQARERNSNAITIPGRALMRKYVRPVAVGLKAWLEEVHKAPGRHHLAGDYIDHVEPEIAALVTLTALLDGLYGDMAAIAWADRLGLALEDEYRLNEMRIEDSAVWKDLKKRTKGLGPGRRKRHLHKRGKTLNLLPPRWPRKCRYAAGAICLEVIERETQLIETYRTTMPNRPGKTILKVAPTQAILDWIGEADEHAARATAVYRPTIDPPLDWEGCFGGGYLTDLVLRRPIFRSHGDSHQALVESTDPDQYRSVLTAINALQNAPWRVNEDVLNVADHCLKESLPPLVDLEPLPLPPKPVYPDDTPKEEREALWAERNRLSRVVHRQNDVRQGRSILVRQTARAAKIMVGETFYMPHRLDFRSRAYPTPNWLQAQGADVARGMLKFGGPGDVMTPEGWEALILWGKELDALNTRPGEGLPVEHIKAVHSDPLEHANLWQNLDNPFQALAWYLEVGAALEAGYPHRPFITHLPVYIDASNNGLQLYSLLTGCRDLARWTNVLPGPKQDLYVRVAELAWKTLLDIDTSVDPADDWAKPYTADWIRTFGVEGIPRACAKRPVMTMPYNVTRWSATDYVREWYAEAFCSPADPYGPLTFNQKSPRFLTGLLMEAVEQACPAAVAGMKWIGSLADASSSKNVPLRWTTPAGWPVLQEYRIQSRSIINAHLGGSLRSITLHEDTGKTDPRRQRTASAPNYVHGVDASIMAEAVSEFEGPIVAIHDAFGTTAPRIPALHRALREAVCKVCIDQDPFAVTREEVARYTGVAIDAPPRYGVIERDDVLASTHMFG